MFQSTPSGPSGCIALESVHAVRDEASLYGGFFLCPSLGIRSKKLFTDDIFFVDTSYPKDVLMFYCTIAIVELTKAFGYHDGKQC